MIDPGTGVAIFAIIVSIFGAALSLAFYCGQLSNRVKALEHWQQRCEAEFDSIHDAIRDVGKLITNGSV